MVSPSALAEVRLPGSSSTRRTSALLDGSLLPAPGSGPKVIWPSGARTIPPCSTVAAARNRRPKADSGAAGTAPGARAMASTLSG